LQDVDEPHPFDHDHLRDLHHAAQKHDGGETQEAHPEGRQDFQEQIAVEDMGHGHRVLQLMWGRGTKKTNMPLTKECS